MTEITQESSLEYKEIEYNLIDDDDDNIDDEYDNNIVCTLNQVIIRMRNNDRMDDKKPN